MQIQLTEIEEYYHLHFSYSGSLLRASYDSIFDYINPRPRTPKVRFCLEKLKNQRPHKREQDKRMAEKKDWALSQATSIRRQPSACSRLEANASRLAHALSRFASRGFRECFTFAHDSSKLSSSACVSNGLFTLW